MTVTGFAGGMGGCLFLRRAPRGKKREESVISTLQNYGTFAPPDALWQLEAILTTSQHLSQHCPTDTRIHIYTRATTQTLAAARLPASLEDSQGSGWKLNTWWELLGIWEKRGKKRVRLRGRENQMAVRTERSSNAQLRVVDSGLMVTHNASLIPGTWKPERRPHTLLNTCHTLLSDGQRHASLSPRGTLGHLHTGALQLSNPLGSHSWTNMSKRSQISIEVVEAHIKLNAIHGTRCSSKAHPFLNMFTLNDTLGALSTCSLAT